ncbi:MAG: hypothetical protein Q7R47_04450 [Candidatus Diapherotrites archaeon]|nr:hypothetical protein [Candidatus Diapherotrites archaeon]
MGFDLYAHMALNNVGGLDEISEQRCIKHVLVKKTEGVLLQGVENKLSDWQGLRDSLYLLGLCRWQEVRDKLETLEVPELDNRQREIVKPLLTIAALVGDECLTRVRSYLLRTMQDRKKVEKDGTNEYAVLRWWYNKVMGFTNATDSIEVRAADVVSEIASDALPVHDNHPNYKAESIRLSKWIGSFFAKYPIIPRKTKRGYVYYTLTHPILERILIAREMDELLDIKDLPQFNRLKLPEKVPPTPPTPPTPPHPPVPPQPTQDTFSDDQKFKMGLIADSGTFQGGTGGTGGTFSVKGGRSAFSKNDAGKGSGSSDHSVLTPQNHYYPLSHTGTCFACAKFGRMPGQWDGKSVCQDDLGILNTKQNEVVV